MTTNEFEVAPGPLSMFRKIPTHVRWWMYSIGMTLFAIEGVLDAANTGLVDAQAQGVAGGILGLFGFTTAVANTDHQARLVRRISSRPRPETPEAPVTTIPVCPECGAPITN